MDVSYVRVDNLIKNYISQEWRDLKRVHDASQGPESKPSRAFRDVLDVPPPKFAKTFPFPKPGRNKQKTAVIFGDSHRPFHDEAALTVVRGIVKESRPDLLVHVGDANDCYTISRYSTDPARLHTLQDDLDSTRAMFHGFSEAAPQAKKIFLGGNHEDRLRKMIWDLKGAARELGKLRVFQKAMTWPVLLDLDAIGWEYVDYTKQPLVGEIPRLLLKHGEVVRKWSGWTAKAEWEKNARSGISGHTHRLGTFYHRDLNGSHVWQEAGCTCSLEPEYVRQPDWQHGCLVVTYTADWFHIATVYIENGRAVWRQKEFAA
jgi:predicted phosphodiesterase